MGKYDVATKSGAIRDPRGFLFMIGRVDLAGDVQIASVGTELVIPPKLADRLFRVTDSHGERLELAETVYEWETREELAISERAVIAAEVPGHKHLPLRVSVAVMKEEGCPDSLPVEFRVDRGDVVHLIQPRLTRLFALDPEPILKLRRRALLPWIALMKGTSEAQLAEAARGVSRDDELAAQFAILAGVRWDRELIDQLLGRFGSMLTVDVAEKTPFGNEILQRGIERGIEKGIEKGVVKGEQRSIRLFLEHRFPALSNVNLDHVSSSTEADSLLKRLFDATTEDQARAALGGTSPAR